MRIWKLAVVSVFALFLFVAEGSAAETDLDLSSKQNDNDNRFLFDPITVTVEKQGAQDVQKVPASVSAITETQIQDAKIEKMEDFSHYVPNLNFVEFGASFEQKFFMRGMGSTHNDPAVSFNIDGVSQARMESADTPLFDIQSIEVLRGPQGTLYGRNSLGGVINIITKKPDNEFRGKLSADLGTHKAQEYTASVSGPLLQDRLFGGIAAMYGYRDGFTKNKYLGETVDDRRRIAGRGHLRWLPEEGKEFNLVLSTANDEYGVFALQPIDQVKKHPHKAWFDHSGETSKEVYTASLTGDIKVGAKGKFTSISSAQRLNFKSDNDYDFSEYDFNVMTHTSHNWQFSQELRYSHGDDSDMFRWVAGLYGWYIDQDDITNVENGQDIAMYGLTPGDVNEKKFTVKSSGIAAFGQGTLTLFERLDLTFGLRGEYEHKKAHIKDGDYMSGSYLENFNVRPTVHFKELLPKFTAAYRITDDIMPYVTISRGYRSGGFNSKFDSNDSNSLSFDPEYSMNYETGIKMSWLDKRLHTNISAFYITLEDMQVNVGVPGQNVMMVDNAGKAVSKGVELEVLLRPIAGLEISGSYGFTDMEFKKFEDDTKGVDYGGRTPPYVPVQNYSLAAQYRHPINDFYNFFVRAEVTGIGKQYWNHSNSEKQREYNLVNAQIGLESDNFDIYLYGKNLTDAEYRKTGYETGTGAVYAQSGDPLTVGVNLVIKF